MKRLILQSIITCFLLFTLTIANAQMADSEETYQASSNNNRPVIAFPFTVSIIPSKEEGKVAVFVNNTTGKKIQLSLSTSQEQCIYTEMIQKDQYQKIFNFGDAEDGVYEIELSCGRSVYKKKFTISTNREVTRTIAIK